MSWANTAILAMILIVVPTVSAGGNDILPDLPPLPDTPDEPPRLSDLGAPGRGDRLSGEMDRRIMNAWLEIQENQQWVQDRANVDSVRQELDDRVGNAHGTAGEVQDQITMALPSQENASPANEPVLAPTASLAANWPAFSQPMILLAGTAAGLGGLLWFLGQSATVGAGAAGTAAATDGRRFLPFASPLFTRFEKDTVLGHPKREAIYGQIIGTPGVTLQDLCETTGLSRTAVTHHLRLMEQQHLIVSKRMGRSRHFFENGGRYGKHQKEACAVLHNNRTKEIHSFIQLHPGSIQKDLCTHFAVQASVAHWHVQRLVEANLLEAIRQGRTVSYFAGALMATQPLAAMVTPATNPC
jgi:DNA-binding transcriptional ArsR family regulator